MRKTLAMLVLLVGWAGGQTADSVAAGPSPRKAACWALLFPGAGQVYNGKYLKAGLVLGGEVAAIWRFYANADLYDNYEDTYDLPRYRYLEKRNKYAWWIVFVYLYGVIDAVVDAHLEPFNAIMNEDLAPPSATTTEPTTTNNE